MDSEIKFKTQSVQVDSICVEDIGNCALEAIDQLGRYFYIIIKTDAGMTKVITFGPVMPDFIDLPNGYSSGYTYMKYSDTKLNGMLQKWALGGKGVNFETITQIPIADAVAQDKLVTSQLTIGGEDIDGD